MVIHFHANASIGTGFRVLENEECYCINCNVLINPNKDIKSIKKGHEMRKRMFFSFFGTKRRISFLATNKYEMRCVRFSNLPTK